MVSVLEIVALGMEEMERVSLMGKVLYFKC